VRVSRFHQSRDFNEGVGTISALMLPELAREMSGSNRHVAEALEAESLRLEELRGKPEETEALKRRAPQSARVATSTTLSRRANIADLWQLTLELFEGGLSAEQSQEMLQAFRNTIDDWLRGVQKCREMWKLVANLGGAPEGLEALNAAEAQVGRIRAAVDKMHGFMTRARPPIDPSLLERGRKEIAEGRYRTADQIRAGCTPAGGKGE
jgi:hypothetical protein